jgi:hypothetical protein
MSKGMGWQQRRLTRIIGRNLGKPLTWSEIIQVIEKQAFKDDPCAKFVAWYERSMRRALAGLVKNGGVVAIGNGRPGDPYRYHMNPMVYLVAGEADDFRKAIEATGGAGMPELRDLISEADE